MAETLVTGLRKLPLDDYPKKDNREEIALNNADTISQNVRRAATGDHADLIGLEIKDVREATDFTNLEDDDRRRYVVVDSGVLREEEPRVIEKKVGLPHLFSRGPDGNGPLEILKRSTIETSSRKVGPPKKVRRGRRLEFERDRQPMSPIVTETPTVTVAEYEIRTGDVLSVKQVPRPDFFRTIDGMAKGNVDNVQASWPQAAERSTDLTIKVPRRTKDTKEATLEFDAINKQLEENNIRSWEGLNWQQAGAIKSVVWDGPVKERAAKGAGHVWVRKIGIKTTIGGKDDTFELFNLVELSDELAAANSDYLRPINLLHIVKPKTQPEADEVKLNDEQRRRILINQLGGNAIRGRRKFRAREAAAELATKATIWFLGSPEIPRQAMEDTMETRVGQILSTDEGKELFRTVREQIINKADLLSVYDMTLKVKNESLEAIRHLDAPVEPADYTLTNVIAVIAKRISRPAARRGISRAVRINSWLGESDAAEANRQVLIDELVGRAITRPVTPEAGDEAYGKALIALVRRTMPSGELTDEGIAKDKKIEKLILNKAGFFERRDLMPTLKGYYKGAWSSREELRKEAREAAQEAYDLIREDREPEPETFQKLGRAVRRLASITPAI